MSNDVLIPLLAIVTIVLVAAFAIWQRGRVAQSKHDPRRSSFVQTHGEAPRENRPGTEH
ncbi:LPXTG cell wall anchor domain-containing protein [Methylorubrum populi]